MPELVEQMYCSEQIVIPPKFPYILKRYCKAAIKTQPYDLLRWSYEYFNSLAHHRPPPVKLRLEYPIFTTEGGLTRGCLKVIAQQLSSMSELPLTAVKDAWRGFCLDPEELARILCLCEVHLRSDSVPYLHFMAVAGGMLTKSITNTMILLCEALTKEPDGGSGAIPVKDFLDMYQFLAKMDASADVKYFNGYREGEAPETETQIEEETIQSESSEEELSDDYWLDGKKLQMLPLINDHVSRATRLSVKLNMPLIGKIERSPSMERAEQIERDNYLRERRGKPLPSVDINKKLREMSSAKLAQTTPADDTQKSDKEKSETKDVNIVVCDEDGNEIPYELFGEPIETVESDEEVADETQIEEQTKEECKESESDRVALFVAQYNQVREERLEDLERTFDELKTIVERFKSANYDLGMVAGRQMSTTSGEFVVQHVEKEIMDYIDDQIAILPDPDLKKKKAKPEEVAMVRGLVEVFIDDTMEILEPEEEEAEEEELPVPDVILVYAVPGIGAPIDNETIRTFTDYALDVCKVQNDLFMPRNIRHFMCPPLEKFDDVKYDIKHEKEEISTGGVFTV